MDSLGVVVEVRQVSAPVRAHPHRPTDKTHAPDGSLTMSEISRREVDWRESQPIVTSCAIPECGWRFEGTVGEAREAAAKHRADAHPGMRVGKSMRRAIEARSAALPPPASAEPDEEPDESRLAEEPPPVGTGEATEEETTEVASSARDVDAGSVGETRTYSRRAVSRGEAIENLRELAGRLGRSPSFRDVLEAMATGFRPSTTTIYRIFGSWPKALEAAGLEPTRRAVRAPRAEAKAQRLEDDATRLEPVEAEDVEEAERLALLAEADRRLASPSSGFSAAVADLPLDVLVAVGRIMESVGLAARDLDPAGRRLAAAVVRDLLDAFLA